MKVTSYAVARPAFYDRAAAASTQSINVVVAPHAQTTRFTYTVPANRKAYVENIRVFMNRQTSAATAATMVAAIAAGGVELKYLATTNNTPGTQFNDMSTAQVTLYPGDVMTGYTIDTSVGGTVNFVIQSKSTEFDA